MVATSLTSSVSQDQRYLFVQDVRGFGVGDVVSLDDAERSEPAVVDSTGPGLLVVRRLNQPGPSRFEWPVGTSVSRLAVGYFEDPVS